MIECPIRNEKVTILRNKIFADITETCGIPCKVIHSKEYPLSDEGWKELMVDRAKSAKVIPFKNSDWQAVFI